jgi:hypothetical protein
MLEDEEDVDSPLLEGLEALRGASNPGVASPVEEDEVERKEGTTTGIRLVGLVA